MALTIDEKLIDLENALILAFPARLQKNPYTKMQFTESVYDGMDCINFTIKTVANGLVNYRVAYDGKKLFKVYSSLDPLPKPGDKPVSTDYKKIKDLVKDIEKKC